MPKKVKVLYLLTESEWAGVSRYVFDLATHLPPHYTPVVAAAGRGEVLEALKERGIKTVRLRWLARTIRPVKDFLAFWEMLFLYYRERPDVIHLNSSKAGFIGTVAACTFKLLTLNFKLLTIFTAHGWVFNEPSRANWFFRSLERFASRFRDVIICVSENDRREALYWRVAPAQKLVTIHNGIDAAAMDFFDRETARQSLANYEVRTTKYELETKLVGTIANLYPNKGLEYLIEAFRLMKQKTLTRNSSFVIQAVIIGDGPERPRLESLIKKYGLHERAFLLGRRGEAWRYLKAFDVFVLSSLKEGLPYVLLEALAAGVPVVATAVGGIPEIKEAGGLTLVPPQNPEALAEAVRGVLENTPAHGTLLPAEFSLERMLAKTLAVYKKETYKGPLGA